MIVRQDFCSRVLSNVNEMIRFFLFSFLFFLMIGCKMRDGAGAFNVVQYDSNDSTVLSLQEGQAYILPTSGVRISVKKVLEDSRCPKGVQCVWAGVGVLEIEITDQNGNSSLDTVSTSESSKMGYKKSTVFGGHHIKLEALYPYPVSGKSQADLGVYNALISVVK